MEHLLELRGRNLPLDREQADAPGIVRRSDGDVVAVTEHPAQPARETAVERSDYPPDKVKSILAPETVAVVGYGVQGRGQSLNMRDNGVKVIVGQRKGGKAYDLCLEDGWKPGDTLFDPEEAAERGTVIQYLLSDAGQKEMWPKIRPQLTRGKALYFSHGFSIVFNDQTGVIPPPEIDVILVAPKGSGTTVRRLFLEGRGINSSFAIHQDATGRARERCLALGIAILGSIAAASYRAMMAGYVPDTIPQELTERARLTLGGAAATAKELGGQAGAELMSASRAAFATSFELVALFCAGMVLTTAFVVWRTGGIPRARQNRSGDVDQPGTG